MNIHLTRLVPVLAMAAVVAGCAADGSFDTGSINGSSQAAKTDPACTQLFAQIDTLRKDGVPEKVEKAANKKYKMTNADLNKADQLNKANAEFQAKCTPQPTQASAQPPPATANTAAQ